MFFFYVKILWYASTPHPRGEGLCTTCPRLHVVLWFILGGMEFTINVPQKVSLNTAMRKHYKAVNKLKQEWHVVVLEAKPKRWAGTYPVDIKCHYFLHKTLIDSGNAGFMTKSLVDALVAAGVFPDDNPKYIRWEANRSDKAIKGELETVDVTITPCATL